MSLASIDELDYQLREVTVGGGKSGVPDDGWVKSRRMTDVHQLNWSNGKVSNLHLQPERQQ